MTLREDVNRVLMDGKEHDTRSILKNLKWDNEVWKHKHPKHSIRCCFLRMEQKGEVVRIKDRVPMAVRRV